jgi:Subtilase family
MPSRRYIAVGALLLAAGVSGVLAIAPVQTYLVPPREPGNSPLHVFGGRSAAQAASTAGAKFDSSLASIARHQSNIRADHAVEDLRAMNPALRFMQPPGAAEPMVLIDAVTRGDPQQLKATLEGLGLQHASLYSNDVGGWLPVSQLDAATQQSAVHSIRAAIPRARAGAVTTQGDYVMNADIVRSTNSLDGTGITVGIISDSYNCYAAYAAPGSGVPASGNQGYASNGFTATATTDIGTGDLPTSVNLLAEAPCFGYNKNLQLPMGDEGRAMMQIVHDVAPGASLAFYTAENSEADFANGIHALANAGAKIIADDVGYFDEPVFQDGIVAQAINAVAASGVIYFSAAGNNGNTAYDDTAPSFGATPVNGEKLLTFQGTSSTSIPLTIPAMSPGDFVGIIVEWDQPYVTGASGSGGSKSGIDLCLVNISGAHNTVINDDGTTLTNNCTGASTLGSDAVQLLLIGNPANAAGDSAIETVNLQVGLASSSTYTPQRLKIIVEGNGLPVTFTPTGPTMQGHPYASGAAAVGAAFYFNTPNCAGGTTATMETFSSQGGDPLLFGTTGARLGAPQARPNKPAFVGPDGGNDTFLGFKTSQNTTSSIPECPTKTNYPNFFGTSAATPHVAAVAALLLQANPSTTPTQMFSYLSNGALPTDKNASYQGAGFVQANEAANVIPAIAPVAPSLSLSSSSITLGSSATLTWSSVNTGNGCTATGSWTGAQASNGTQVETPSAAGSYTYTLACTNAAGNSPTSSVTLTVTTPTTPPAPTLTLASTTVAVGASTTITWSSPTATSCAATGSWSGSLANSGTQTVSQTAAGTYTYTLACTNSAGTSPTSSVTLTVNAAASSGGGGGGGGAFDLLSVLGLGLIGFAKARRSSKSLH